MTHIKFFFIMALATSLIMSGCKSKTDDVVPAEQLGAKYLHPTGITILSLKGTYFEMGKQYGRHMKTELKYWSNYYETTWKAANPEVYNYVSNELLIVLNKLYMSDKIVEFLDGVAITAGMTKNEVYRLDQCCAFDYAFSGHIPIQKSAACTFVGAYGAATGGHTIIARNLDLQRPLAVRDYNSVITVMHPSDGDHKVATFGFVGFPQGYVLMNLDNNVVTEYNTGNSADKGSDFDILSRDMMDLAFDAITDRNNTDAQTTAEYLRTGRLLSPSFFGVADKNTVLVVQRAMNQDGVITQNSIGNNINGVTNVFLDSTMHKVKLNIYNASTAVDGAEKGLDTPARGMVRWVNLVNYFKKYPTGLDIDAMKTIIATDIADSGVFISGYEKEGTNTFCKTDATFGSVVIDLSDLTQVWWLRYDYATKNKTWDMVDLTQNIN
ncbi:MAG: hypothetical protein WCP32_07300 [Bacteroidota bacterium]